MIISLFGEMIALIIDDHFPNEMNYCIQPQTDHISKPRK